ncbi:MULTISPECIES: DUF1611 domain-containing protein [unclassified Corallococcus]|uniref:DUF1611 domain-containing protein n=1 Tax=unclassified Corallococcus TaxID=2685029 RepID=UPI001A8D9920|nr:MULTISPECIES: DUF1611 domain-containing protein [unclassified Corallococcus]MBN9686868.1 DUF1611 domain-containing protein [Corallococcus sp. NCSPR001]WAS89297.1 DUF1611 domain-containing protein [Corallococcus sp. NCRR]
MKIHVDKVGSVTRNLQVGRTVHLTDEVKCEEGAVIAVRIHGEKSVYNQLEDVNGRLVTLHAGDIVVGALGHRNALHGYEGIVPASVTVGDRLHILNMGGVIGKCTSHNPGVGAPFEAEVLGQVLTFPEFQSRAGQHAHISTGALKGTSRAVTCPVVYVVGTCMNAGKTYAASVVVRKLSQAGYRVGGAKLTGVSLMRDTLSMQDSGADVVMDFTDAGVVCTGARTASKVARIVFSEMAAQDVDVIVAETGDGIMGEYGVQAILADPELKALGGAFILCANDPVGAAGGVRHLREVYGIEMDMVAGPATDNAVGVRFVEQVVGLPARNARADPNALGNLIVEKLAPKLGAGRKS